MHCDLCQKATEAHHATKCSGCGKMMCGSCLYLPTIYSPCWCAECRGRSEFLRVRMTNFANNLKKDAQADLRDSPKDSPAFGHADGRLEAAMAIIKDLEAENHGCP